MSIASLPMLTGKIYAIFDSALIQSAHRNRNLSMTPVILDYSNRVLQYDDEDDRLVRTEGFIEEFTNMLHASLIGRHIHRMNVNSLRYIASRIEGLCAGAGEEHIVPNLYIWTRDLMTYATTIALYGPENPITEDRPDLVDDYWYISSPHPPSPWHSYANPA